MKAARITLAAHALETLPDSLKLRRHLLQAIVKAAPRDHKVRIDAHLLLEQLDKHERAVRTAQASFPFLSTLQNQPNGTNA